MIFLRHSGLTFVEAFLIVKGLVSNVCFDFGRVVRS